MPARPSCRCSCALPTRPRRAPCTGEEELARLRALPVVAAAARTAAVPVRYEIPGVGNLDAAIEVIIDDEFPTPDGTPIVVEGRLLDPAAADEVVLPEGSDAGLGAGAVFAITPLRLGGSDSATPIAELRHELTAVGKVRQPSSLAARIGELEQEPEAPAVGPGWWQRYGGLVSYYGIVIQVRPVPGTDPEVLRAEVAAAMGERFQGSEPAIGDEQLSVASAIRYEASALGLFAAAVAVAALVFVGQALARQASREASDTDDAAGHRDVAGPARGRRGAPGPAGRAGRRHRGRARGVAVVGLHADRAGGARRGRGRPPGRPGRARPRLAGGRCRGHDVPRRPGPRRDPQSPGDAPTGSGAGGDRGGGRSAGHRRSRRGHPAAGRSPDQPAAAGRSGGAGARRGRHGGGGRRGGQLRPPRSRRRPTTA